MLPPTPQTTRGSMFAQGLMALCEPSLSWEARNKMLVSLPTKIILFKIFSDLERLMFYPNHKRLFLRLVIFFSFTIKINFNY